MARFSEIILASTSETRRLLMNALGIPYRSVAPGVDETLPPRMEGRRAVQHLAEKKAVAVFERHPDALVIGSDQMVLIDDDVVGKPADRSAARGQLKRMLGKKIEIATGLSLVSSDTRELHVDVASFTLYPIGDEELERYLDTNEWEGCAGSFRVEGKGQALFESLTGDFTSVQGLPMQLLVKRLRALGVQFFTP